MAGWLAGWLSEWMDGWMMDEWKEGKWIAEPMLWLPRPERSQKEKMLHIKQSRIQHLRHISSPHLLCLSNYTARV